MNYVGIKLDSYIDVDQLYAFHYFEFAKDYVFHGERHDFWEFFYVDKGEVVVYLEDTPFEVTQGDVMLYEPNVYHRLSANRITAANMFGIAFASESLELANIANRVLRLNESERELLAQIVKEGFRAFAPPYNHPDARTIARQEVVREDSEQLLRNYLEILLIRLVRRTHGVQEPNKQLPFVSKEKYERDQIRSVTAFLRDRLDQDLSLDMLCETFNVGKTYITRLFKRRTGYPLMEYFKRLKAEQAKMLVREEQHNFTEIARLLGYGSIHHFSKAFKRYEGMTPSEYAQSIQALAGKTRTAENEEQPCGTDTLIFGSHAKGKRDSS